MLAEIRPYSQSSAPDLDYFLRRAEEEAIAEIRSSDAIVAQRHGAMAQAYSERVQALLSAN